MTEKEIMMGFDGARAVVDVTGEYPDYLGHPLTLAWEIMTVFRCLGEALPTVTTNGLNCPGVVADNRLSGGGSEVHRACHLLRLGQQRSSASELIVWADEKWIDGQAGGHLRQFSQALHRLRKSGRCSSKS